MKEKCRYYFYIILTSFFQISGLCIPAIIETVFRYPDDLGRFNWVAIKNGLLVIISIVALITGSYASILGIIEMYTEVEEVMVHH